VATVKERLSGETEMLLVALKESVKTATTRPTTGNGNGNGNSSALIKGPGSSISRPAETYASA
jgi:hypothetical protein